MATWEKVREELKERGLSYKYDGTWYLTDAIAITADAGRPIALTKELYPTIAQTNQIDWKAVERSIRWAMKRAGIEMEAGELIREVAAEVVEGAY